MVICIVNQLDCIREVEKQAKFNNEQMQSMRLELKANEGVKEKLLSMYRYPWMHMSALFYSV